jgi:hypothetical protein
MSRSGYSDDCENIAMWRGMVASATRGKRGQALLRALLEALDAMPEKRLIPHELESDGEVCALGALGRARGMDISKLDPEEPEEVAAAFNIAPCLAQEIVYMNDEYRARRYDPKIVGYVDMTPEERWQQMRDWVAKQIRRPTGTCSKTIGD